MGRTKHKIALISGALIAQTFSAAFWNLKEWGSMIGNTYFNESFTALDFVFATLMVAFLPTLCSGIVMTAVIGHRKRHVAWYAILAILFPVTVVIEHMLYFHEIRSLCCGSTW